MGSMGSRQVAGAYTELDALAGSQINDHLPVMMEATTRAMGPAMHATTIPTSRSMTTTASGFAW
jgi:hypothetical protein